jgi:hypothetical protein
MGEQATPQKTKNNDHSTITPTAPTEQTQTTTTAHPLADLVQRAQHNPALLKPPDVLQLQRTLGNAAVVQLMRAGAKPAPPAAKTTPLPISKASAAGLRRAILQRLIGFEIETRIPLYRDDGTGTNTLERPDYDEVHSPSGTGDNTEISVDKHGETSIIELVTQAVDDSQITRDFRRTAENWVRILTTLHAAAGSPPEKMTDHIPAAGGDLYFGFQPNDDDSDKDHVAVQATHGIRLDKVEKLFSKTSIPEQNRVGGADTKKSDAVGEVGGVMDTFMGNLVGILDPSTVINNRTQRTQAVKDVRGFFALLAHYLIVGGKEKTSYLKNQTMLFYKSKMSAVRDNLILNNAYAQRLFQDAYRDQVITQLLTDTNRTGGDPLFMSGQASKSSTVTCQEWLDEVLQGIDDRLFEQAKNDWGSPIAPGSVKGNLAAVLEHRDLVKEFKPNDNMDLNHPDLIVDYLVAFFSRNKKMQDIHHG